MGTTATSASKSLFAFPYYSLRNISCPEDQTADRKVYSGHAPAESFLELPTHENVRGYLVEAEGKLRRTPTQVHRQMRDTLQNHPEDFSILNGGIVIVARDVEIDEKTKIAHLKKPSIINGSQTQGELRNYFRDMEASDEKPFPVHVTFELIVTDDDSLIAEVSISRNFQNDVALLSIIGRREQLDELEKSLQDHDPSLKLKKSEAERSEDYQDTEKLLQVITALIPEELWPKSSESGNPNKVYTYSMKAKCLRDYQEIYRKAKDPKDPEHKTAAELYQFFWTSRRRLMNFTGHGKRTADSRELDFVRLRETKSGRSRMCRTELSSPSSLLFQHSRKKHDKAGRFNRPLHFAMRKSSVQRSLPIKTLRIPTRGIWGKVSPATLPSIRLLRYTSVLRQHDA